MPPYRSTRSFWSASFRQPDLTAERPSYSPPYIHRTGSGQRVCFQTWQWEGDVYRLVQYIIEDENTLSVRKYECAYRVVRRAELTSLLLENGCENVVWKMPEETGFFQPVLIARRAGDPA